MGDRLGILDVVDFFIASIVHKQLNFSDNLAVAIESFEIGEGKGKGTEHKQ